MTILRPFLMLMCCLTALNILTGQGEPCATDVKMQSVFDKNPGYHQSLQRGFDLFKQRSFISSGSRASYNIPVHVIILYKQGEPQGEGTNLTMERIQAQLEVLNRDFNRLNSDTINTPHQFSTAAMSINFCLATLDPEAQPTNGVTRKFLVGNFQENEISIKEETAWPRDEYLNIWVAPLNDGTFGFSYIPTMDMLPEESLDGIVINSANFGGPGDLDTSSYDRGRMLVHEMGHFLGLRHIWGVNGCGDGDDDGLEDTPKQDSAHYSCVLHPSFSCGNSGDMFMNYMDYTPDSCRNAFTQDQVAYMTAILEGPRKSLLGSVTPTACAPIDPVKIISGGGTNPRCFNGDDGIIRIVAEGGQKPYKYFLDGVLLDSSTVIGKPVGKYMAVVQDQFGQRDSLEIALLNPPQIDLKIISDFRIECNSDRETASVTVLATGGVIHSVPFVYRLNGGSYKQSGAFFGLPIGTHIIEARDNNLCLDTIVYVVKRPDSLQVFDISRQRVSCFGGEDGGIFIEMRTGVAPFVYYLDSTLYTQSPITGLKAGTYSLKIEDDNGCALDTSVTILQPNEFRFSRITAVNIPCTPNDNSELSMLAQGGTSPYTYYVNGSLIAGNKISPIPAGTYNVEVRDGNGCTIDSTVSILRDGGMSISMTKTNTTCSNSQDASAKVTVQGGSGEYTITINGFALDDTGEIPNLSVGSYQIVARDRQTQCTQISTLEITGPPVLSLEVVSITTEFIGGKQRIEVKGSGGTPPYQYSINGTTFQSSSVFTGNEIKDYIITIQDSKGCSATLPVNLLSTEENEFTQSIQIFPNPFNNEIQVEASSEFGPVKIELYNINGQLVPTVQTNINTVGKNNTIISAENLQESIYFLKIATRSQTIYRKILKI